MLNRITVSVLLKSVFAIMAITILVLLSVAAWSAWTRLATAGRIAAVTNASVPLYAAWGTLRFDRIGTVLELKRDRQIGVTPEVAAARETQMPALKALVSALSAVDFPDREKTISEIERSLSKIGALHVQTAAALRLPKAERPTALSQDFNKELSGLIDLVENLTVQLGAMIKLEDSYIDHLMLLKTEAWNIRNNSTGVMIANGLAGQPMPPDALQKYFIEVGKMDRGWTGIQSVATGMALPDKIRTLIEQLGKEYFGRDFVDAREAALKALMAGEKPNYTLDSWSAQALAKNTVPLQVSIAALELAKDYAAEQYRQSFRILAIELVMLGVALAIAVGMMFIVSRRVTSPLIAVRDAMARMAAGDFEVTLPGLERKDEIGDVANAVERFKVLAIEKAREQSEEAIRRQRAETEQRVEAARLEDERAAAAAQAEAERQAKAAEVEATVKAKADAERAAAAEVQALAVRVLGEGLQKLADGDLTHRIGNAFPEAYGQIKSDFNAAMTRLQETIQALVASSHEVASAAAEISTSTTDLSLRTEAQAASMEETSASMEEISATVKHNAENAQQANTLAAGTREIADRSGQVVTTTVGAMARIEESSRKISDIIGVIDEIARQTNLLALNAAVEAARAGDAGRGFAVVASEVRSLAQRSSQAAKDIKDLITSSSGQVREGVELVNRTGISLNEIVGSIKKVADIVADIATASVEQSSALDQISKALAQMDEATQQNSALVEENAATGKTLEQQARAMTEEASFFRVAASNVRSKAKPLAAVA